MQIRSLFSSNPRDGQTEKQTKTYKNIPGEAITIDITMITKTIRLLHIVGGNLITDTIAHDYIVL